jgi:hypothetical protein
MLILPLVPLRIRDTAWQIRDGETVQGGRLPGNTYGKIGVETIESVAENAWIGADADRVGVTIHGRLIVCSEQSSQRRPIKSVHRFAVSDILTVIHDHDKAISIRAPGHLGIPPDTPAGQEICRLSSPARLVRHSSSRGPVGLFQSAPQRCQMGTPDTRYRRDSLPSMSRRSEAQCWNPGDEAYENLRRGLSETGQFIRQLHT